MSAAKIPSQTHGKQHQSAGNARSDKTCSADEYTSFPPESSLNHAGVLLQESREHNQEPDKVAPDERGPLKHGYSAVILCLGVCASSTQSNNV